MSDLARVLRILAKHANACADELDGEPEEPEPVKTLEDIKAERAERHAKLRK